MKKTFFRSVIEDFISLRFIPTRAPREKRFFMKTNWWKLETLLNDMKYCLLAFIAKKNENLCKI